MLQQQLHQSLVLQIIFSKENENEIATPLARNDREKLSTVLRELSWSHDLMILHKTESIDETFTHEK